MDQDDHNRGSRGVTQYRSSTDGSRLLEVVEPCNILIVLCPARYAPVEAGQKIVG